ncbi:peptidoglycan-binding protein [Streptomyces sp. NPDC002911]
MASEQGGQEQEEPPGVQLAQLLRRWWEAAGNASGGTRPTQQALASRLGIDQTTLSRYLNRNHQSTAPPKVVAALHAQLRAPAEELERAHALCRAALEDLGRQRAAGSTPVPADRAVAEARGGDASGRSLPRLALPVVVAVAVLSFLAGTVVQGQFAGDRTVAASGSTGAGPAHTTHGPQRWPLVKRKKHEDQFTWGRTVQNLLKHQGYELEVDGIFGDRTYEAVMDFQKRHQLSPDGKVGDDTWPALVVEIHIGANGFPVRAAQELLDNAGQGGTEVSGTFTPTTASNVRFFQQGHGLPVTGAVDVPTWRALLMSQSPADDTPAYQKSPSASPSVSA